MIFNPALPRDGLGFVGLLVGGYEQLLQKLRPEVFEEFGVSLKHQWTEQRFMNVVPRDVEVICVLTDHCSHGMSREAHRLSKVHGMRFVLMGRKRSAWLQGFRLGGFMQKPSWLNGAQGPKVERKMIDNATIERQRNLALNGHAPKPAPEVKPNVAPVVPPMKGAPCPTVPRVVKMGQPWNAADIEALMTVIPQLTEETAHELVPRMYGATGAYRTPHVTAERIRSLGPLLNPPKWLSVALSRQSYEATNAKISALAAEEVVLRQPRDKWPDYISGAAADKLVGHRQRLNRTGVKYLYDTVRHMNVYATAEVLAVIDDRESRGLVAADKTRKHGRTVAEWEQLVLTRLGRRSPQTTSMLLVTSEKPLAVEALSKLVKEGRVVARHTGRSLVYALPGTTDRPAFAPKPEPVKPAPAPALQPEATGASAFKARLAIIRDMREGRLTSVEAALLLAELSK